MDRSEAQAEDMIYPAPRRINLAPEDWLWATWLERPRRARPTPPAFNKPQCLARLLKLKRDPQFGWVLDWKPANITSNVSREEAHFWLIVADKLRRKGRANGVSSQTVATQMSGMSFDGRVPPELIEDILQDGTFGEHIAVRVMMALLDVPLLLRVIAATKQKQPYYTATLIQQIMASFRSDALPFWRDEELEELRKLLRPQLQPDSKLFTAFIPIDYFLAAAVGMQAEMRAVLSAIPAAMGNPNNWDRWQQPLDLVMGLGSAAEVEGEARRLGLKPRTAAQVRGWLATTGTKALDLVMGGIMEVTIRDKAQPMIEALAIIESPEAAPVMLQLQLESKGPRVAREWLEAHPAQAVEGLIPIAAGRGRMAGAATEYLHGAKRKGHGDLIRRALADQPAEIQARIRGEVLDHEVSLIEPLADGEVPPWLAAALGPGTKRARMPACVDLDSLPPIILGQRRLSDAHVAALCVALKKNDRDRPHPLIVGVKQHAQRDSLDKFAWKLFEGWQANGAPSGDKWTLLAIGALGGDGCVLKLTPLIRAWPGESQHQRAVAGLRCLREIGSDAALMALNGIAQKLKFKGVKSKAMEMMEAIAADRNMSRVDLEDRIVPDCELDERGTRIFDFGPRQFRFVLGPDMKPMLKDEKNKVRGNLPSPGAQDDAVKAAAAIESWNVLKKMVKEVAKVQATRLEQSMVTGRRWNLENFDQLVVKHPLMTNLARLVVWSGFDATGALTTTFRVTDEQHFADENDDACSLSSVRQVGVVHPAHLTESQRRKWGEVLGDYELIPPFRQLDRTVFALDNQEVHSRKITRFKDLAIAPIQMVGMLERMAWQRGMPEDGGVFHEYAKPFYGANVTAIMQFEPGVPVGYMIDGQEQRIMACFIVPGIYTPKAYPKHADLLTLGKVDGVVISEVLRDLTVVASKGK